MSLKRQRRLTWARRLAAKYQCSPLQMTNIMALKEKIKQFFLANNCLNVKNI